MIFLFLILNEHVPCDICPGEKKLEKERKHSYSHLRDSQTVLFQLQGSKIKVIFKDQMTDDIFTLIFNLLEDKCVWNHRFSRCGLTSNQKLQPVALHIHSTLSSSHHIAKHTS
jgi:hypothetical protein